MKFKLFVLSSILIFVECVYSMEGCSSVNKLDQDSGNMKIELAKWQGEKLITETNANIKTKLKSHILIMESWKNQNLIVLIDQLTKEQKKNREIEKEINGLSIGMERMSLLDKRQPLRKAKQLPEQPNVYGGFRELEKWNGLTASSFGIESNSRQGKIKIDSVQGNLGSEGCMGAEIKSESKTETIETVDNEMDDSQNECIFSSFGSSRKLSSFSVLSKDGYPFLGIKFRGYRMHKNAELLMSAVQRGDLSFLIAMISSGIDINSRLTDGRTALYMAAKLNNMNMVRWLIYNGADIEIPSRKNFTALHVSAMKGHLEMVQELVYRGANIHALTDMKVTPLWLAAHNGYLDIVKWLVSRDANINDRAVLGFTPLHIAVQNGHLELVKWLATNGANVYFCTVYGDSILHIAAENKHLEICRYLASEFELMWMVNNKGKTALEVAKERNYKEIEDVLKEFNTVENYTNVFK